MINKDVWIPAKDLQGYGLAQAAEEKNYFGGFLLKKKTTEGILGAA